MDYFIIIVTMTTLFFGLLFFVDDFPTGTKEPAEYISFSIMVISTFIVVVMILWDANTRRKNDKKKIKMKLRKRLEFQEHEDDTKVLLLQLHNIQNKDEDMFNVKELPWEVDHIFKFMEFQTDSETPEEFFNSMNDIFENLFSYERFRRKFDLFKRKGKKTTSKIVKKFKKKTKEDQELEIVIERIRKDTKFNVSTFGEDKLLQKEKLKKEIAKVKEKHEEVSNNVEKVERKSFRKSNNASVLRYVSKDISDEPIDIPQNLEHLKSGKVAILTGRGSKKAIQVNLDFDNENEQK
jgi:hypothetical protein